VDTDATLALYTTKYTVIPWIRLWLLIISAKCLYSRPQGSLDF